MLQHTILIVLLVHPFNIVDSFTTMSSPASYRLHNANRQIVRPATTDDDEKDDGSPLLLLFANERIKVFDFRLRPIKPRNMDIRILLFDGRLPMMELLNTM